MKIEIYGLAIDVIRDVGRHLDNLREYWGPTSPEYRDTAESWARALTRTLDLAGEIDASGNGGEVWRDGPMSIGVTTSYGMQVGIIGRATGRWADAYRPDPGMAYRCDVHDMPIRMISEPCEQPDKQSECMTSLVPVPMEWSAHS